MKNILDKINRADEIQAKLELDKIELAKHEVNLGLNDDLNAITTILKSGVPIMDKLRVESSQIANEFDKATYDAAQLLIKVYNKKKALLSEYNAAQKKYSGQAKKAVDIKNKYIAAVKELGLTGGESKSFNELQKIIDSKAFDQLMNIDNKSFFFEKMEESFSNGANYLKKAIE